MAGPPPFPFGGVSLFGAQGSGLFDEMFAGGVGGGGGGGGGRAAGGSGGMLPTFSFSSSSSGSCQFSSTVYCYSSGPSGAQEFAAAASGVKREAR